MDVEQRADFGLERFAMTGTGQRLRGMTDRFLFESCDPNMASVLRIGFGLLLCIYSFMWWLDGSLWFSDQGVLKTNTAEFLGAHVHWSLFSWIQPTPAIVNACLLILMLQSGMLLVGLYSRVQAASIFFWLVSFQNRNPLILDGEDTVFRIFAFLFIFLPLDHRWSIGTRMRGARVVDEENGDRWSALQEQAWALRLVQIQMTVIYLSATLCKLFGSTWQNGSAMFYVANACDYFGRFGVMEPLFGLPWFIRAATWSALAIEAALPILLWFRPTRRPAIVAGIGLHLAIEASMIPGRCAAPPAPAMMQCRPRPAACLA